MAKADQRRKLWRRTEGTAMVEFALCLIVLMAIILGTLEFGLIWYTKYIMAEAAREGARYGAIYRSNPDGSRMPPMSVSPSIQTVVNNYLTSYAPTGSYNVQVTNNTGYQTGQAGYDLIVKVTAANHWNLLGGIFPNLNNINIGAQTSMKCE
jgi:Flp pilus assembly protein TadG